MKRLGNDKYEILDPVKKLWHRGNPIHFDDQGIETLTSEANKYKGQSPLIFADAYSCLVSPLGLNEALPEANDISEYAPRIMSIQINPEKIY